MKTELKVMGYYQNTTRNQVVQIKDVKRGMVWYEVLRQDEANPISEFCCTQERFNNLYIKSK
jgi:hypothetical protein